MPRLYQRRPSHTSVALALVGVAPLAEHQVAVGAVAGQEAGAAGMTALVVVGVFVAHFFSGWLVGLFWGVFGGGFWLGGVGVVLR